MTPDTVARERFASGAVPFGRIRCISDISAQCGVVYICIACKDRHGDCCRSLVRKEKQMAYALQISPPETSPLTPLWAARRAIAQGLADGTAPFGLPAALMREHGTLKLYLYEPRGLDRQTPHTQDEVYVIVRGSGVFAIGDGKSPPARMPFNAGDAIFTPAGAVHRFEEFTEDFTVWVLMYGPDGGEGAEAA